MTIIVFLLDTSASMNQRVFLGGRPTLLDVAKSAVETFVKVRQRSAESRQDRYMLLTFEEPPSNIKAGWKENLVTFMTELKNLQANGLTTLGNALRHTFDVLNVNRMQHGIDTYGQGRSPFYLEPSIIVAITDGGKLSSNSGVQEELKIHGSSPGCELTREPFRWDQRLFSLVLRMSGQPLNDRETGLVPSDNSPIDAMCEVTGGRSYCITSHRMLLQCIDSLVQKVQAGVVIHFEKMGPEPAPLLNQLDKMDDEDGDKSDSMKLAWHNCHKMIYVPRTNQKGFAGGFWPIPEAFWPDTSLPSLPPRTAHPHVKFTCVAQEPLVVENFPFDKYELEPSPLTQYILARKQPSVCWQAFVANSAKSNNMMQPFGYLKASTNLTCVNLFVMPHNYPVLLPLLDELFRVFRLRPSNEWRAQFGMYLASMPGYYAGPLKRALIKMNAGAIAQTIPEETYLSYSVLTYLKKLKTQAKMEYERTCNEVGIRVKANEVRKGITTSYKNPFDVPRHQLLEHLAKLKSHFLRPTPFSDLNQDNMHSMPVSQMGNYQEYLKRQPTPLREIESAPVRQHMFGNPFKVDKRMIIDETDIDLLGQNSKPSKKQLQNEIQQNQLMMQMQGPTSPALHRGMKRKRGPLPLEYHFVPKKSRKTMPLNNNNRLEPLPTPEKMKEEILDLTDSDDEVTPFSPESGSSSSPLSMPEYKSPSYLSDSLALWTDEDFQDRETDDDRNEELPDVGNDSPDEDEEEPVIQIPEPIEATVCNGPTVPQIVPEPVPRVNGSPTQKPVPEPESVPPPVVKVEPAPTPPPKSNGTLEAIPTPSTSVPKVVAKSVPPEKEKAKEPAPTKKLPEEEVDIKPNISEMSNNNHHPKPSTTSAKSVVNNHKASSKKKEEVKAEVTKKLSKKSKEPKKPSKENIAEEPHFDEEKIRQLNLDLRVELFKEIRRPRFRMDFFLTKLTEIAGSERIKTDFLKMLEREAKRFKRKRVAEILAQQITG